MKRNNKILFVFILLVSCLAEEKKVSNQKFTKPAEFSLFHDLSKSKGNYEKGQKSGKWIYSNNKEINWKTHYDSSNQIEVIYPKKWSVKESPDITFLSFSPDKTEYLALNIIPKDNTFPNLKIYHDSLCRCVCKGEVRGVSPSNFISNRYKFVGFDAYYNIFIEAKENSMNFALYFDFEDKIYNLSMRFSIFNDIKNYEVIFWEVLNSVKISQKKLVKKDMMYLKEVQENISICR